MYISYIYGAQLNTVFHSTLTVEESNTLERIRRTCLKFALKCSKHEKLSPVFPSNNTDASQLRNPERFHVNFAATSRYRNSTIPYCQRLLNDYFKTK